MNAGNADAMIHGKRYLDFILSQPHWKASSHIKLWTTYVIWTPLEDFWKKDYDSDTWMEVPKEEAVKKVRQALRDAKPRLVADEAESATWCYEWSSSK